MINKLSQLSSLFYFLFFIPIAVGLAFLIFDFDTINIFSFDLTEVKIITIVLNTVGIAAIKLLDRYFKSIKSENFGFDKKLDIFKAKMFSAIAIIYLLEVINIFSFLRTGDNVIILIYFLMALFLLVYIPNKRKIENI